MTNNDQNTQGPAGRGFPGFPNPKTLLSLPGELRNEIYYQALIADLKHQYNTYLLSSEAAATILDRNAEEDEVKHAWYMAEELCCAEEFQLQAPQWMGCCRQARREAEEILYWNVLRFEELIRPERDASEVEEEEEDFESLAELMTKPSMESLFSHRAEDGTMRRKFSVYVTSMENLVLDRGYREPEETARWESFLKKNSIVGRRTGLVWFPEETGMLPMIWVVRGDEESEEDRRVALADCGLWDRAVV